MRFWRLNLATCSWLIPVAKNACFAQIGLNPRKISKNFSFFPRILWLFIVLSASPSSKTTIFTHKTSIFFINPSPIFKKKYGFSLILKAFHVSSPGFLGFCVFVEIWKYDVRICFVDVLLRLMYRFCWFWYYNAYYTCFTFLFLIFVHYTMFVLCCAYHVYDKMSHRRFLVFLWIPWNTMLVGIIMCFLFWNIIWLCVFTLSPNLHTFAFDAHTHTHSLTCLSA